MIGIIAIPLGLIAAALTLALARIARVRATSDAPDPAGDALATILAYGAAVALSLSALLVFDLLQGVILIAFPMLLGRLAPASPGLVAIARLKLRIAWVAIALTLIALLGVVSLYSEVLSNG